jgi:uncharacterized protein YjeT (DUF2065 family)
MRCDKIRKSRDAPGFFCVCSLFILGHLVDSLWTELLRAFALMLVLEGIMPFLYPKGWRDLLKSISVSSDSAVRTTGLVVMLIGVVFLYLL